MEISKTPVTVHSLGITSVALGALGGFFYWWTPLGMVVSLAGGIIGFVGWVLAAKHSANNRLLMGGMMLCALTLILNLVIAAMGLEVVRFHDLR
jgi:hypothetical protein